MYEAFVKTARETYVADKVKDGIFGAMMGVSLVNDGPVTCVAPAAVITDFHRGFHGRLQCYSLLLRQHAAVWVLW